MKLYSAYFFIGRIQFTPESSYNGEGNEGELKSQLWTTKGKITWLFQKTC